MVLPIPPALLLSRQNRFQLQDATFRPPALCPDDEGAEIPWVLLDLRAYIAERNNATTAFSETLGGHRIQVTLFLARPPGVSYLCVFCPGLEHTVFPIEPKILAIEEDLILLRVIATWKRDVFKDADCYIYKAADEAAGGRPSLKRLPRPPRPSGVDLHHVGILRYGTSDQRHHVLRPHRDIAGDFYIVAGLCRAAYDTDPGEFVLCLYNSNFPSSWSTHNISLDERHRRQYGCSFHHVNSKVIAIGGDAGTMGFVDLWRGILFCDVLKVEQGKPTPSLRYVMLPPPLLPDVEDSCDAELARDIAIVEQGHTIKYVELQVHWKPCPTSVGGYVKDGWMSRMWSRPVAADCSDDGWEVVWKQESSDITVDSVVLDGGGRPLELKGLLIWQSTLSLCDDDTVYFMAKKNSVDGKAWVIAVDMQNKTLQQVTEFAAERTVGMSYSRISKYLTTSQGTLGNLKRPGTVLLGSSNKKPHGFWTSMPPWDDEQEQQDAKMEDSGDMVLDVGSSAE